MRLICQIVAEQWTHVVAELMKIVHILSEGFELTMLFLYRW